MNNAWWTCGKIAILPGALLFFFLAEVALAQQLTWRDLDELFEEHFIAVAGPSDATPEALVETILQDPTLPSEIREPFVALARKRKFFDY